MSRRVLFAVFCAVAAGAPAPAQDIYLKETRSYDREGFRNEFKKDPEPPTPQQLQQTEIAVRTAVYPLTEHKFHLERRRMGRLIDEADSLIKQVFNPESTNTPLQKEFGKKMVEELDRVMAPKQQAAIARINAGRVLARLAEESGYEETVDLLVKVITDPDEVDGARFWACRGLRNLFARAGKKLPLNVGAARRQKALEALVAFIQRKPEVTKMTPEEELNGLRVLRREAVRALAELRDPGAAKPNAHAALTLVRVLAGDTGLVPSPRLDEKVEAAIGVCQLRPDAKGDYQPGYGAFFVGRFLVELGSKYAARKSNREPWKIHAARLDEALRASAAAFPADKTVKEVARLGADIARSVQQGSDAGGARNALDAWLRQPANVPTQASVYKSDPKSVVTLQAAGAQ